MKSSWFSLRRSRNAVGPADGSASLPADELEAVEDLLDRGNGAARQVVVYEANHDLREVVAEIVAATAV